MKRFSAILLLTVTVFSIAAPAWERYGESMFQICRSVPDCGSDGGCSVPDCGDGGDCSGPDGGDGSGGCSGCCSPFHACGSCHGFEPAGQAAALPAPAIRTVIPVPCTQLRFTAFCKDIRHPPESARLTDCAVNF